MQPSQDRPSLQPTAEEQQAFPSGAVALKTLAVVLWLLSLFLPVYVITGRPTPISGAEVALWGVLLGWLYHGWAAYANLLMFYVLAKRKPAPTATPVMLLVAAQFFFIDAYPYGQGLPSPIVAWGWGVVAWWSALLTAAIASVRQGSWLSRNAAGACVGAVVVGCFAVASVHWNQYRLANEQERATVLQTGMAIAKFPLCEIQLEWPTHRLVPEGASVRLDVDPRLTSTSSALGYVMLPQLPEYEQDGIWWKRYKWDGLVGIDHIVGVKANRPAEYILKVQRTSTGAEISLIKTANQEVLYMQRLKAEAIANERAWHCPYNSIAPWQRAYRSYDQALELVISPAKPARAGSRKVQNETLSVPCDPVRIEGNLFSSHMRLDGRELETRPASAMWARCSTSQIVTFSLYSDSGGTGKSASALVMDRGTLEPLAIARFNQICASATDCRDWEDAPPGEVVINGAQLVVTHPVRELTSKLFFANPNN